MDLEPFYRNVFQVELALTLLGLFFALWTPFSSDACGASDRCYRLVDNVTLWLLGVQTLLGAVCGVAFWRSKRIIVKRAAAVLLPIGLVATWVVADRLLTQATNL